MKLHILFGHREESYDGEHAPEPLLCWSEYEVDENPDGFDEAVEEALKMRSPEFTATKMFTIEVDQDEIVRRLREVPTLTGQIDTPQ